MKLDDIKADGTHYAMGRQTYGSKDRVFRVDEKRYERADRFAKLRGEPTFKENPQGKFILVWRVNRHGTKLGSPGIVTPGSIDCPYDEYARRMKEHGRQEAEARRLREAQERDRRKRWKQVRAAFASVGVELRSWQILSQDFYGENIQLTLKEAEEIADVFRRRG